MLGFWPFLSIFVFAGALILACDSVKRVPAAKKHWGIIAVAVYSILWLALLISMSDNARNQETLWTMLLFLAFIFVTFMVFKIIKTITNTTPAATPPKTKRRPY